MNNDIEFIKWLCDKAEGFSFGDFNDVTVKDSGYGASIRTKQYEKVIYPLLLQRAIEGVNREGGKGYFFNIDCERLEVYPFAYSYKAKYFHYYSFDSIDQAKESALKYIWESEKK